MGLRGLTEHGVQAGQVGRVDAACLPLRAGPFVGDQGRPSHSPQPPPSPRGARSLYRVSVPCFLCHLVPFNKRSSVALQPRI